MTSYFPVVYNNNQHQPMQSGDKVDTSIIQVSARSYNEIQILTDGLYVGSIPALPVVYVTSAGTDATTSGAAATPYKTLDYAISQVVTNAASTGVKATIALKSGETFTIGQRTTINGDLVITFYGDANYGDFNSANVGGKVEPYYMEDLVRPIIQTQALLVNSLYQSSGLTINGSITLNGVKIQLPSSPNPLPQPTQYATVDMFLGTGNLNINGIVVNNSDTTSVFGFVGVTARSKIKLEQLGCQFLVNNRQLSSTANPVPTTAELLERANFLKFYADVAGGDHTSINLNPTSLNSSNGSGFLELYWSEAERQLVAGSSYNLATFPSLTDPTYGLAQYFTGLRRDQQSRTLNVISGRLF